MESIKAASCAKANNIKIRVFYCCHSVPLLGGIINSLFMLFILTIW